MCAGRLCGLLVILSLSLSALICVNMRKIHSLSHSSCFDFLFLIHSHSCQGQKNWSVVADTEQIGTPKHSWYQENDEQKHTHTHNHRKEQSTSNQQAKKNRKSYIFLKYPHTVSYTTLTTQRGHYLWRPYPLKENVSHHMRHAHILHNHSFSMSLTHKTQWKWHTH